MENKVLPWIPQFILYAIILAIPVGFIIAILFQKVNFALNGLILGIPIIAAAILFLKIQKRDSDFTGSCVLFPFDQQSLIRIFFIIFTILFIVTLLFATKSTVSLILIVFLYCIILIQIFSKNPLPWVIITEIVLTLIIYIYINTLTSSYFFSWTDNMPHAYFATITYLTGHLIPTNLDPYSYFPLFHIWIAMGSALTGFNSYTTITILTCPVFALSAILVYLLFDRIIQNQQVVLLTCLFYSSSSIVLFYSTYVVTRTMAFIGFILLLYLLYNAKKTDINNRGIIFKNLALVVFVFILLVHQVSTPIILVLLTILLLCEWIIAQQKYIRITYMFLIISLFFGYWFFYAYSFTSQTIAFRLNPKQFETITFVTNPIQNTPLFSSYVFLTNNVHVIIFLFFGIIGMIYIIWRKKTTYFSVFGLFVLLTILLYIPSPLDSLWQTMILLSFDRFQLLIVPFMALMMAGGIWVVSKYFAQIKIPIKIINFIILLSVVLYSCSSIGLIHYEQKSSLRKSFNADELIGFNFIQNNIPSDSYIFSDYFSNRYLFYPYNSNIISDAASISLNRGYFVITKKQFLTDGLYFSRGSILTQGQGLYSYTPTKENIHNLYQVLYSTNQIYSSNSLEIYVR